MPLYEYECEKCVDRFNRDISRLVKRLNRKNASEILRENPGFLSIEVAGEKTGDTLFSLGEKSPSRYVRRFRYVLEGGKVLSLELRDFKFSELMSPQDPPPECPSCGGRKVKKLFSTFKAVFDRRNRAPGPGDELAWHKDYKIQKDEEQRNWVGQDNLNQYFKG